MPMYNHTYYIALLLLSITIVYIVLQNIQNHIMDILHTNLRADCVRLSCWDSEGSARAPQRGAGCDHWSFCITNNTGE